MRHYMMPSDDSIVEFDDETKEFAFFFRIDEAEERVKLKVEEREEAESRSEGRELRKCGRCKAIGHYKNTCTEPPPSEIVPEWKGRCLDCDMWEGTFRVPVSEARCLRGHSSIEKVEVRPDFDIPDGLMKKRTKEHYFPDDLYDLPVQCEECGSHGNMHRRNCQKPEAVRQRQDQSEFMKRRWKEKKSAETK